VRTIILAATVTCTTLVSVAAAPALPVDLALVLAVDVSGSMDEREQHIQRDGYVGAFRSPQVVAAITGGLIGSIAVTYVEWSSQDQQTVVVPWTLIDGFRASASFADALAAAPLRSGTATSISEALLFSSAQFEKNVHPATQQAIDVSGDGPNSDGGSVTAARDTVLARGITINGLPIFLPGKSDAPDIDQYYANCVIGGPNAFLYTVNDLSQLPEAIRQKLLQEIAFATPPPGRIVRAAGGSYVCDEMIIE